MKSFRLLGVAWIFIASVGIAPHVHADYVEVTLDSSFWNLFVNNNASVSVTVNGYSNGIYQEVTNPDPNTFSWIIGGPSDVININMSGSSNSEPDGPSSAQFSGKVLFNAVSSDTTGVSAAGSDTTGVSDWGLGVEYLLTLFGYHTSIGVDAYGSLSTVLKGYAASDPNGTNIEVQDIGTDTIFGNWDNDGDTGLFGGTQGLDTSVGLFLREDSECTGAPCALEMTATPRDAPPLEISPLATEEQFLFIESAGQANALESTSEFDLTITFGVATVVPIPAAVWLFGSGLLGLVGMARRKKAA
jgi:hypothetical protein